MVKHIILWKLKNDIADKASVKAGIKSGLDGLKGAVPGLVDVVVRTAGLASSNADVMLDSTFESEAARKRARGVRHEGTRPACGTDGHPGGICRVAHGRDRQ